MVKDRTALVLSTDASLCSELEPLLAKTGFRMEVRPPGRTPLRDIRERQPDLALLDISVDAQGLELIRRLESGRSWGNPPLIVTCEQADLEYELLDVFDFLAKPLDHARLKTDLALLVKHAEAPVDAYPPLDDRTLGAFQDLIYRHSGLHFDERNRKILERGLMRRMRATRAHSHRHYLEYLRTHARSRGELKKLLALLTIGETYFFRYLAQFEALKESVLPELIKRNRQRRSLRLWSAGCSTGEEPYSLAILLREHFSHLRDWDIDIIGTDINPRSLKTAQEGIYRARALRVLDQETVERYFTPEGSAYRLDESIRKSVRFAHLNLQTDPYPDPQSGIAEVDIIFCRNVMIYFRPQTIKAILEDFHRCLKSRGYLFLGHSESLASITAAFSRVSCQGGFFYQRCEQEQAEVDAPAAEAPPEVPAEPPATPPPNPPPQPPAAAASAANPAREKPLGSDPEASFREAEKAFQQEDFETARRKYDIVLRQNPRHVGALLGKGFIHANRAELDEAQRCCREALAIDDLAAGGYFLLGLIHDLRGETARAQEELRKAIMLDIDFAMSHYNLGKIYQRQGRSRDARRELDNTCRILEELPDESLVPYSGGLSREVFLEICREDRETGRS